MLPFMLLKTATTDDALGYLGLLVVSFSSHHAWLTIGSNPTVRLGLKAS
jgi:hypothetical protein